MLLDLFQLHLRVQHLPMDSVAEGALAIHKPPVPIIHVSIGFCECSGLVLTIVYINLGVYH
jgi:hypothetical protein